MNKSSIALTLATLTLASGAFAAKQKSEPVVMTVGKEKVTLSEFEYLFKKNNEQQAATTSLDEYIDMFVNYKLKVVAAKDAGLDTVTSYLADMNKYTRELARPYLRDAAVDDSLVNVAYAHTLEMVNVDHILIPTTTNPTKRSEQRALADSVHRALLNGADFGELALKYSLDKASASRGGHVGYIVGGLWPYTFEDLAFTTPVGEISPVKESAYGYHIVRVVDRKPNPGTVKTRHILKSTTDMDEEGVARQRQVIDSILSVVKGGADFATVARMTTDEPQGRQSGGDLPWFSNGQMVSEFNDAAFAMKPGEISEPVKTRFGWHIILCEDRKGVAPLDSVKTKFAEAIRNDERSRLAIRRTVENWKASAGVKRYPAAAAEVAAVIEKEGTMSPAAVESIKGMNAVAASVGAKNITIAEVAAHLRPDGNLDAPTATEIFNGMIASKIDEEATNQYIESLPANHPDYRNLLNEYRDGMLLYEISNAEVWERANTDSIGLQNYYLAHIDEYTWDRPHYKGYVIAATTDSLATEALAYLASANGAANALTPASVRKRFGNDVKIERVLAAKGDNAVVDHLCFGAAKPSVKGRWQAYRTYAGKVIDSPEDARDVKGQVSLGYQQQLEAQWLQSLHKRYKVKVDRKALHKAFPQQ